MDTYKLITYPTIELIADLQNYRADPYVYAEWLCLFYEYNQAAPKYKVGMMCKPCYFTVYEWYLKQLENA